MSTIAAWRERQTLWDRLKKQLHPSETDEIKRALGSSLIDRVQDLLSELHSLVEILEDYRQKCEEEETRFSTLLRSFRDPRRSFIELQLQEYISELRCSGVDATHTGDKERKVIEYLEGDKRPASRAGLSTPRSPLRPRSQPVGNSRPKTALNVKTGSSPIDAGNILLEENAIQFPKNIAVKLSIERFNGVAPLIRQLIEQDELSLLQDIEYMRLCLEDEHEFYHSVTRPPPDLVMLEQVRTTLEQKLKDLRIERLSKNRAAVQKRGGPPALLRPQSLPALSLELLEPVCKHDRKSPATSSHPANVLSCDGAEGYTSQRPSLPRPRRKQPVNQS